MKRNATTTTGVLVALLCLVLLVGCTSGSEEEPAADDAGTSDTADSPEPEKPAAGACYRLDVEAAEERTNDAEPVGCKKRHTARTIAVGDVTAVTKGDAAPDSAKVQNRLASVCPQRARKVLGGTPVQRNLSRFVPVWFTPTTDEIDAGATWFRCDVVAFGRDDSLLPLPTKQKLKGVLDRKGALNTFGTCGTAAPDAKKFTRVACKLKHSWRAVTTIRVSDAKKYPGPKKARQAGNDACADEIESRRSGQDKIRFGWEWPSKQQWEAGQRYGFCWAPSQA